MKKWTFLALAAIIFYGCSKSGAGQAAKSNGSQWTLNGVTYNGVVTGYNDTTTGLGILVSTDAGGNYLSVIFFSHPTADGQYVVTSAGTGQANGCQVQAYVYSAGAGKIYTSVGKTGDQVNVSFTGGKIALSFTNITVAYNSTDATLTGTAKQQ
jgi:hypothetical protein